MEAIAVPTPTSILTALLVSAVGASQSNVRYSENLFCEREFADGSYRTWTRLEVDRSYRLVARSFSLTVQDWQQGYRADWQLPAEGQDSPVSLTRLDVGAVALPDDARFPVTATLRFDGELVRRIEFARATTTIVIVPPSTIRPRPDPTYQRGVEIELDGSEALPMFGVRHAQFELKGADGRLLATRSLRMPDWAELRTRLRRTMSELEVERIRRRCRPHASVTVSLSGRSSTLKASGRSTVAVRF